MKYFSALLSILLLGLIPDFALAQVNQTPDGAHQFIALTASQGTTTIDPDWGQGYGITGGSRKVDRCYTETYDGGRGVRSRCNKVDEYSAYVTRRPALLVSATKISKCETELKYSDQWNIDVTGQYSISPLGDAVVIVNWEKIAKIQAGAGLVYLSPIVPGLRLKLPSEDLAKRMAYAMEFLKASCDKAAETGF